MKPNTITGIRLRKFSVGRIDLKANKCRESWIELVESDGADGASSSRDRERTRDTSNADSLGLSSPNGSENVNAERNFTQPGRFCGYLRNFWSSYYSSKRHITINYYKLIKKWPTVQFNDTFEFEITFYDKESLNPIHFSKQMKQSAVAGSSAASANKQQTPPARYNYGTRIDASECSRYFADCSAGDASSSSSSSVSSPSSGCVINSPGYPGIYLKNSRCHYLIRNTNVNTNTNNNQASAKSNNNKRPTIGGKSKLIVINDNVQVDGTMCNYEEATAQRSANHYPSNSYFCDTGLRTSGGSSGGGGGQHQCNDRLSVYNGLVIADMWNVSASTATTTSYAAIVRNVCGIGRLPKIVSSKNAVLVELESGSDGLFANTGFLFHAMNQHQYFENYHVFNQHPGTLVGGGGGGDSERQLNALKQLEMLQIETCNSDMRACVITIDDHMLDRIYSGSNDANEVEEESEDNGEHRRLGYLYGLNQYHGSNFTLTYVLRTKRFNTIAVYLDKFESSAISSTSRFSSSGGGGGGGGDCASSHLSIETTNQLITNFHNDDDDADSNQSESDTASGKGYIFRLFVLIYSNRIFITVSNALQKEEITK